ncbi:hypothetical protein ENUP19_0297G0038 [Entamoeba nuttalli]|uniref:CCR4/NOT transcription complex subunit 3, putative n=2 Tax=Entamoeba nuttalli TaxID=412467 RepID=K2H749_ENTNP|nr:CCR4/NOT transcription complex subunit 3, putative [Entamoeba nuttalli P19]EKE38339.1 CCR4/NOT transcription complex subunit 3, putative [Entamoeba nuttalli P19]|eukprot:XP_008859324.1 CCR4/NOT transcription complex subunit 3, putative [Entamoeba nuttalli P19]
MSTNRKVQSDIDKTLKVMNAGFAEFDEIREKLDETEGGHQHEKIEADLKKSLKKLQKCREQIKGWLQTEIKNKNQLTEAKKQIEERMEAFKEIERISKIKPYSIEGLARVSDSGSVEEQSTEEEQTWIEQIINNLQSQIEDLNREKEPQKKKKQSQQKKNQILKQISILQNHIENLNVIDKALKYGFLDDEDVNEFQEEVEMTVESKMITNDDSIELYKRFDLESLKLQIQQEELEEEERRNNEIQKEQPEHDENNITQQHKTKQSQLPLKEVQPSKAVQTKSTQQILKSPTQQVKTSLSPVQKQQPSPHQTTTQTLKGENKNQTLQRTSNTPTKQTTECTSPVIDEKTLQTIKDIEFSYNSMIQFHHQQSPKRKPSNLTLPKWFPTQPIPFDFKSNKIEDEFLMFLFYYAQGTELQLQAAEMLKQRKWKYHKGYQKWFKKLNDPIYTSEVSENGEYCCFEYESWNTVSKSHFTFFNNFMEN